jgi:hypothetical protein
LKPSCPGPPAPFAATRHDKNARAAPRRRSSRFSQVGHPSRGASLRPLALKLIFEAVRAPTTPTSWPFSTMDRCQPDLLQQPQLFRPCRRTGTSRRGIGPSVSTTRTGARQRCGRRRFRDRGPGVDPQHHSVTGGDIIQELGGGLNQHSAALTLRLNNSPASKDSGKRSNLRWTRNTAACRWTWSASHRGEARIEGDTDWTGLDNSAGVEEPVRGPRPGLRLDAGCVP